MREDYGSIDVQPVTGALGAEVHGVDLAGTLENDTFSEIYDAFLDHLVLFFHDQHLTPDQHKAFARRFGDIHIHPLTEGMPSHPEIVEIVKLPDEHHNWGDGWHTDLPFLGDPPLGSVLYAREVPPFSGDTHFANMYLAYETLSDTMKNLLQPLKYVFKGGVANYSRFQGMTALEDAGDFVAVHPIVRTHPATGRKALYLHRKNSNTIAGMSAKESAGILEIVHDHAQNPDFACRFRWRANSIAMWDNRCAQHRVSGDYFYSERGFSPGRRHLQRVTMKGDRPF
jgi:taurine dioxygenase